jgi:hypothetical protein
MDSARRLLAWPEERHPARVRSRDIVPERAGVGDWDFSKAARAGIPAADAKAVGNLSDRWLDSISEQLLSFFPEVSQPLLGSKQGKVDQELMEFLDQTTGLSQGGRMGRCLMTTGSMRTNQCQQRHTLPLYMELLRHLEGHITAKAKPSEKIRTFGLKLPDFVEIVRCHLLHGCVPGLLAICLEPIQGLIPTEVECQVPEIDDMAIVGMDAEERRPETARLNCYQRGPRRWALFLTEHTGLFRNRLGLQDGRHGEMSTVCLLNLDEQVHGEQRVSPGLEEIIVDADLLKPE